MQGSVSEPTKTSTPLSLSEALRKSSLALERFAELHRQMTLPESLLHTRRENQEAPFEPPRLSE